MSGCVVLERVQPRQQPQRRERREGGEAHVPAPARHANLPHGGIEAVEQRRHHAQQRLPRAGELDVPGAAQEQRRRELVFERADLTADGRLRQVQLGCRGTEAELPRDRLESADRAYGERSDAGCIHDRTASMRQLEVIGSEAARNDQNTCKDSAAKEPVMNAATMTTTQQSPTWRLAPGQALRLPAVSRERWLRVLEGEVWLTLSSTPASAPTTPGSRRVASRCCRPAARWCWKAIRVRASSCSSRRARSRRSPSGFALSGWLSGCAAGRRRCEAC